jgi:Predicted xylanase/chitin deacetylase
MKKILLWHPYRPDAAPARLEIDDTIASACVRAGVAAAADPAEAGALSAGGLISAENPVEIIMWTTVHKIARRVMVPIAVAIMAVQAGAAVTPEGRPLPSGVVAPVRVLSRIYANDGSVGQTYTAPASMTGCQWYREALTVDRTKTAIAAATNSTYLSTSTDGPTPGSVGVARYRLGVEGMVNGVLTYAVSLMPCFFPPTLLEGFQNAADWTPSNATVALDTTRKVQGSASLVVKGIGVTGAQATKASIGARDPATMGTIAYYSDAGDDPEMMQSSIATLRIGQGGSYVAVVDDLAGEGATSDYKANGYWVAMHVSESATITAMNPATAMGVRVFGPQSNSPFNGTIRHDALLCNAGSISTWVPGWDDGRDSQMVAADILESYGWRGTFYMPVGLLGQPQRFTWAQVLDLAARGHDIQLDGDYLDRIIPDSYADVDAYAAQIISDIAEMTSRGLPRPRFICYPTNRYRGSNAQGTANVGGTRIQQQTCTFSSGQAQIAVTSTTNMVQGQKVIADGLPESGTFSRIATIDDATHVTLTIAPTTSGTKAASFTTDAHPWHTMKMQNKLRELGFYGGRTAFQDADYFSGRLTRYGQAPSEMVHPGLGVSGLTGVQMAQRFAQADLRGLVVETYMHMLDAGGNVDGTSANQSINVYENNLRYLCNDRKAKEDAGLCMVLTETMRYLRDGASSVP